MRGNRLAVLLLTTLLALSALVIASCSSGGGQASSGSGTLRVGVRADVVNFGYLNEQTGKYYGLEIDIAARDGGAHGLCRRGIRHGNA